MKYAWLTCRTNFIAAVVGMLAAATLAATYCEVSDARPVQVDISMDTGRGDTATSGWHEWQVPDGLMATKEIDGVQLTLRAAGKDQKLQGQWYKAGLATGASTATDGVEVTGEGSLASLELEIRGLAPGKHSLVTYHNFLSKDLNNACSISLNGEVSIQGLKPTVRVATNEAAESAFLEFESVSGQPVVIRISASGDASANRVILNGIEIDGSDPKHQAQVPTPADFDWHVDGDSEHVQLGWERAPSAVKQYLYLCSDKDAAQAREAIESATSDSPAYLGSPEGNDWDLSVDRGASLQHYCWRVDSVDRDGNVTRGDLWRFRVRQLAFPGAEGYGRFAIGGRGGRVIKVTNLNDSGLGSLRAAVEAKGPRIVLFDVSGRIVLQNRLGVRPPYLTLAGQTAPGKGICISNYNLGLSGTHDAILRFLRVRPGDTAGVTLDGMGMAGSDHSIIDHCSISWSHDEAFSSRGAKNITLQRTLISEALNVAGHSSYEKGKQHGYAASIGGDVGSFHHNLLAHCAGRNWSLAGGVDKAGVHAGQLDLRNNVVYNWGHRTTDGGARQVNFVNNYYLPGPSSHVFHVIKPQHELPFGPQEYFVMGNVMEGHYEAEQRYAGVAVSPQKPMEEYIVEEPFFESYVTTTSARDAFDDVLSDVGCNRPVLDEHDKRVIEETRTGTTTYEGSVTHFPGLPDSQKDVGGWDDYPEKHRSADWDSDGDGLPNWWEQRHGLNPNSAQNDFSDTHADNQGDGYTNIEEYLHWMASHRYEE